MPRRIYTSEDLSMGVRLAGVPLEPGSYVHAIQTVPNDSREGE
jgi:hypothetical protein